MMTSARACLFQHRKRRYLFNMKNLCLSSRRRRLVSMSMIIEHQPAFRSAQPCILCFQFSCIMCIHPSMSSNQNERIKLELFLLAMYHHRTIEPPCARRTPTSTSTRAATQNNNDYIICKRLKVHYGNRFGSEAVSIVTVQAPASDTRCLRWLSAFAEAKKQICINRMVTMLSE